MEQYRYCIDIVDQGVTSVSALAAILMEAPYWYFWWDQTPRRRYASFLGSVSTQPSPSTLGLLS